MPDDVDVAAPMAPIYTTLVVPMMSCAPSSTSFQWSADGQACFFTKTALYIMTPDHGLNYDPASAVKITTKENPPGTEPVGWYRTQLGLDNPVDYLWPDQSRDWCALVLGQVDMAIWAIAISPSSISPQSGCVVAALTSSMDFTLWVAGRNGLKGGWLKICDVTPLLLDYFSSEADEKLRALKSQITSIRWSSQTDFGLVPAPLQDASLLIAGNRVGTLILLRYNKNRVDVLQTRAAADSWIVNLAISNWKSAVQGTSDALLAYATENGVVELQKVRQTLVQQLGTSSFGNSFAIDVMFDDGTVNLCARDHRPCTTLEWFNIAGIPTLFFAKPGVVYLWRETAPDPGSWSGIRSFFIHRPPKTSAAQSPFHPIAGVQYIRRKDALLICLADGTFHVLHHVTVEPSWTSLNADESVTTDKLCHAARLIFERVEQQQTNKQTVNRISGMTSHDGHATVAWLHEATRPGDYSYKHDAKHQSFFVVAKLWDDDGDSDDALTTQLSELLYSCRVGQGLSPASLLRPIFFDLTKRRLERLHSRLLDIIKPNFSDHSSGISIQAWDGELGPVVREEFKQSLKRHLFGWNDLLSLRLRLAVGDFVWSQCGLVAQTLLNNISHRVLRTLIRHITPVVSCLKSSDVPFVLRLVVQSFLPGSPPDLVAEGEQLSAAIKTASSDLDVLTGLNERCPACKADIPLQDITSAQCPNGHSWLRCSITTFILATSFVRTCVGCSRKAFLPLASQNEYTSHGGAGANWLPEAGRGWVVEEMLEAVNRCLFCGNSFVSLL
ncbi:unnamed protein product [Mycena citricolor]|uniref:Transcription factor IIIC 90kDa subunit N-terminal domain-containing protein n=1 Tax=Mycena citricolor TaxID=2018698 RepID=A0AAD2K1R4_9AGAR|nr:unnamed protein product [Mycena citricolor]